MNTTMERPKRIFEDEVAVKGNVPLLIGITSVSGAGKTYSALRLATGIQRVTGGEIFGIDTESSRMKHYADRFTFRHIDFKAPFGSLDYLDAVGHCVKQGAKVIIVDSMSNEHEGVGGHLEMHEAEYQRLGAKDSINFLAWVKPKMQRRQFINGILQMNCNFIFCFRAKDKIKPVPGGKPIELGYQAIAGEEFLFEQTVNILLMPNAEGVPTWHANTPAENAHIKLPIQFRDGIFPQGKPLDESTGEALARWAQGDPVAAKAQPKAAPLIQKMVDAFGSIGVDVAQLEDKMGHRMSETTEQELKTLRIMYKSIQDKHSTVEQSFGGSK